MLLLIIDLQNGFIDNSTRFLPSKISKLLSSGKFSQVLFTRFINSPGNFCCQKLNFKKCISKKDIELAIDHKEYPVIDKHQYTAYNDKLIGFIEKNKITQIYICGIDTDCCVLKTALDLFENNYDVKVLEGYCASTGGKRYHRQAIKILKRNIGRKNII